MKTVTCVMGIEHRDATRSSRGFTLLELLLVLTLAALAMTLSTPSLLRSLESAQLSAAAAGLHATLRQARWQAVRERRELSLVVDTAKRWYRLDPGGKRRELPEGSTVLLVGAASEQLSRSQGGIRFYPDGSASGGSIDLRGTERRYRINVEWLSGRALLRRDNVD